MPVVVVVELDGGRVVVVLVVEVEVVELVVVDGFVVVVDPGGLVVVVGLGNGFGAGRHAVRQRAAVMTGATNHQLLRMTRYRQ